MIGMVGLINAILGVGLLLAGRKLFWLFVGAAGFVLGAQIVIRSFHGPEWLGLVIGIIVGLLFAGLAVFLRAAAIGIAGFIAGASILVSLVELFRINVGGMAWLVYLAGGVIGILLVSLLFNWALITLSSLGGAALIVAGINGCRCASDRAGKRGLFRPCHPGGGHPRYSAQAGRKTCLTITI